jgi:hypothetical protein
MIFGLSGMKGTQLQKSDKRTVRIPSQCGSRPAESSHQALYGPLSTGGGRALDPHERQRRSDTGLGEA